MKHPSLWLLLFAIANSQPIIAGRKHAIIMSKRAIDIRDQMALLEEPTEVIKLLQAYGTSDFIRIWQNLPVDIFGYLQLEHIFTQLTPEEQAQVREFLSKSRSTKQL